MKESVTDLGHGIFCIDTGYVRPGLAAAYLIIHEGSAAFVDCGTTHSVPRLLGALDALGIGRSRVEYVMPTHVHLDHAGGAGELMRQLPDAKLVAHPRGAPHLIDPARLTAGATAVYGEETFQRMFGTLVPVPAGRVIAAGDGYSLDLQGRPLRFLDTPGHARHHYSIHDETSGGIFSGDTFGLCYRELDRDGMPFIFPTTTPVQFDPEAWYQTLERYASLQPRRMYLTHFGAVGKVGALSGLLRRRIRHLVNIALAEKDHQDRGQRIRREMAAYLVTELKSGHADVNPEQALELFDMDLDLNAQGLEVWLDRLH